MIPPPGLEACGCFPHSHMGPAEGTFNLQHFFIPSALLLQEAQIFLIRPLVMERRKPASFAKMLFDLPENEVFCTYCKGGTNPHTAVLQYPSDFGREPFNATAVCSALDTITTSKDLSHGAVRTYPAGKGTASQVIIPLSLCNHFRRGIRHLDMYRRVYDVLGDQPRSDGPILTPFCLSQQDGSAHTIFRILSCLLHKTVISACISIPEILVFSHCCHSFLQSGLSNRCVHHLVRFG